ncbi:Transposase DDE domain protein [Candidatus Rubidus massiliensis]|nr:Transposase DDE domain protein [Candidatus Rubidus massiliensis]CDZ79872.1 Transposase DDE domain protein [Candidatus Rubidus massiliensis]CDZ80077.1 Transposase DDE domain protein [Candidatus Rubidus massiliensis]CDZ81352.1 Transposase DDE domain protein [Candidatus Rubidus massiliensis]CDZ81396.1 Transposase DDE domain protein [Candidatus Rubidus massiliensis]
MKKRSHEILEKCRELLLSTTFKNACRSSEKDFSRNRILRFPLLIVFILNLAKRSLQSELIKFSGILTLTFISKQLLSTTRKKILPIAFVKLNDTLISEFYTDNKFPTYLGFRLIVIDGSTLQLPESISILEKYGSCGNQKNNNCMPMAQVSYAYDPLSGLTLDAIISPYGSSERSMACDHILKIQPSTYANDLYIFDRGYPSLTLIFLLAQQRKNYLIRCTGTWLSEVRKLIKNQKRDTIIEISPKRLKGKKREDFKKRLPGVCLNSIQQMRVLIIDLPTGEQEFLITSLLDKDKFEYAMFIKLYHSRWGVEENYKFHKVRIEMENFSGESTQAIEQDFHATIFTANVRALLTNEAQEEMEEIFSKKMLKHDYKINQNIAIGILKDEIVKVLLTPESNLEVFCKRLKQDMKKNIVSIRPGRKYIRIKKTNRKYPMNMRRAL